MEKIFRIAAGLGYENLRYDILTRELESLPPATTGRWALFVQEHAMMPGNEIVAGIEAGTFDPDAALTAYPAGTACRLEIRPGYTFHYEGPTYLKRGSVITDAPVSVGSEVFGRLIPFTNRIQGELTFRIGTQAVPVGRVSDNRLILGKAVVYTAVGTLRSLGCGLITDERTRQAVGAFVITYENPADRAGNEVAPIA